MEPVPSAGKYEAERSLVSDFLATRDRSAFQRLYRSVTPSLYLLVIRLVGRNEYDAQDILQDVWIRAVERIAEFRWESSFQTWISGIAINRCRELYRQRAKLSNAVAADEELMEKIGETVSPSQRLDLEDAIAALSNGFRAVLVLHDVEGFTHEEIAILLDIEPGTSKSQLSRARKAVRHMLSAD